MPSINKVCFGKEHRRQDALWLQHWQKRKRQRLAKLWILLRAAKLSVGMQIQHICPETVELKIKTMEHEYRTDFVERSEQDMS